jgi:hypothetical protein
MMSMRTAASKREMWLSYQIVHGSLIRNGLSPLKPPDSTLRRQEMYGKSRCNPGLRAGNAHNMRPVGLRTIDNRAISWPPGSASFGRREGLRASIAHQLI